MADGSEKPGRPVCRCCYADVIHRRVAGCTRAARTTSGYRVTVRCSDHQAQRHCMAWLDRVRLAARFTLGVRRSPSALPRRDALKLQAGSLLGMDDVLEKHRRDTRIRDISALLDRALARYGDFEHVPLEPVIQRVQGFEPDER